MTAQVGTEVNWIDPTFLHYVADRGPDCFANVIDGCGVKIAPPTTSPTNSFRYIFQNCSL